MVLVCFSVSGCWPQKETETSDFVKIVIADRTFKIPKGYLDGAKAIGKDTESIVLEYSLPRFEVLPPHPQERAARKKLIMEGRMRGMLLEAARNRPALDEMIEGHRRGKDRIGVFEKDEYGLNKYSVKNWREQKMLVQPDDTFIEENNDGAIKSFLMCSPPNKDKIPGCRHTFIDKGILYRIRWSLRYLPRWQEQRQAAIDFIDNFEVKDKQ